MSELTQEATTAPGREHRRRAAGLIVAALALTGAAACQAAPGSGGDGTDTPSLTQEPTTPEPSDTGEAPDDWSDAVFPECGDTFTPPERPSQLTVTAGPSETLGTGGAFMTEVTNQGSQQIQGDVALPQTVVVDADGVVVATVDLEDSVFWGAEGGIHLAIAGGETLPFRVSESWTCDGESESLGAGEYEVYVLLTMGEAGTDDPAALEQAQGGPFPMVIDDDVEPVQTPTTPPDGGIAWAPECGDGWSTPEPTTGWDFEILDEIRSPRSVDDPIEGVSRLTVTEQVAGAIYNDVVLLQDGKIVSPAFAGDSQFTYYLSAGSTIDLTVGSALYGCEGELVEPGDYQAVVVTLLTQWTGADDPVETSLVAVADPVDLVIE